MVTAIAGVNALALALARALASGDGPHPDYLMGAPGAEVAAEIASAGHRIVAVDLPALVRRHDPPALIFVTEWPHDHLRYANQYLSRGFRVVDLTPSRLGRLTIPAINPTHRGPEPFVYVDKPLVQLVGPVIHAVNRVAPVRRATIEVGPASGWPEGWRPAGVDHRSSTVLEHVGVARRVEVIARPDASGVVHRVTCELGPSGDEEAITTSVGSIAQYVGQYLSGYRVSALPLTSLPGGGVAATFEVDLERVDSQGELNLRVAAGTAALIGRHLAERVQSPAAERWTPDGSSLAGAAATPPRRWVIPR